MTIHDIISTIEKGIFTYLERDINAYLAIEGHTIDDQALVEDNPNRFTPLIMAAFQEDLATVKLLVEKYKANPNVASQEGRTALMYAVRRDKPMVKFLLASKANPKLKSHFGMCALHYACYPSFPNYPKKSNLPIIKLLLDNGAIKTLNALNGNNQTPLDIAALRNQTLLVEFLVDQQAEVASIVKYTPLEWERLYPGQKTIISSVYKALKHENRFITGLQLTIDSATHNVRRSSQAKMIESSLAQGTFLLEDLAKVVSSYLSVDIAFEKIVLNTFSHTRPLCNAFKSNIQNPSLFISMPPDVKAQKTHVNIHKLIDRKKGCSLGYTHQ